MDFLESLKGPAFSGLSPSQHMSRALSLLGLQAQGSPGFSLLSSQLFFLWPAAHCTWRVLPLSLSPLGFPQASTHAFRMTPFLVSRPDKPDSCLCSAPICHLASEAEASRCAGESCSQAVGWEWLHCPSVTGHGLYSYSLYGAW